MPASRPEYSPGNYYHIYNRGFDRSSIFREEDNYLFVLRKLKNYLAQLELTVIAYCLMPNHYHWLIRQNGDFSAGLLAQRVFNGYTKAYNLRYNRSGTLFQGPYKVQKINNIDHLLNLCRYIHCNPVKDGLLSKLENWPYSNYLEWVGKRKGSLVEKKFVSQHFSSPKEYEIYCDNYLTSRYLPEEIQKYINDFESLSP